MKKREFTSVQGVKPSSKFQFVAVDHDNYCLCFSSCSLTCFKAHKENGNCEEVKKEEIVEDKKPDKINVFTTVDTVRPEKLEELEKSDTIKQLLKNPHLRNFLREINSAPNSWNAMKLAMMEPIFLEFADECLKTVEPDNCAKD